MVLVVADSVSTEAGRVVDHLRSRGARVVWFDPATFPVSAELAVRYTASGEGGFRLVTPDGPVDLERVASAWHWHHQPPVASSEIADPFTRKVVEDASQALVSSMWQALDCSWLPARPALISGAKRKAAQLRVAAEAGLEVPPTLITNSPTEFLDFYRAHHGDVISKLVAGFGFPADGASAVDLGDGGSFYLRYAEPVAARDAGYAHALRLCPVILQAAVPKLVEVRAYVIGQQVLAAEIHSQGTNRARHDWRKYDRFQTRYAVHDLPEAAAQRCVRVAERLGLRYGAVDLILTPDGRYVFLEINTHGHFEWIEVATGLPVSAAIGDLLLSFVEVRR